MGHMTQADWDAHIAAINEFHSDAFQQPVTWKKMLTDLSLNGEDDVNRTVDIELKALVMYNYFRAWPTSRVTKTGEIDAESCLIYLNNQYLSDGNYLNSFGQFQFNPVEDRFIIAGIAYKASGESQVAQAGDKPILHFIILKREEIQSHDNKY